MSIDKGVKELACRVIEVSVEEYKEVHKMFMERPNAVNTQRLKEAELGITTGFCDTALQIIFDITGEELIQLMEEQEVL